MAYGDQSLSAISPGPYDGATTTVLRFAPRLSSDTKPTVRGVEHLRAWCEGLSLHAAS